MHSAEAGGGSATRFVILHYHIFKNAGMTIENILDRNFGERSCRFETSDRDEWIPNSELLSFLHRNPHLQAISSHHIRYPVPAAAGFLFFDLCFLRDPLDRIRSMYDYLREKPSTGDPVSELANQLDLGRFVAHLLEHMPNQVNDVQVGFLANGAMHTGDPGTQDLDRATRRMMQTSFLGVVDCFEKSLIAGQHFLNPVFPNLNCAQSPVNVSQGLQGTLAERKARLRDACGPRLYADLTRRNAAGLELVDRARGEVERRFNLALNHGARRGVLTANRVSPRAFH